MAFALERSEKFRAHRVLMILREKLTIHDEDFAAVQVAKETRDPFRVLIVTILSQSCTDIAAMRAYRALDKRVGIIPVKLRKVNSHTIERAIRAAIAEALVKAMASPLRDYDEWLQFVCAEAQDASHYFAFFLDGHRTIPIEWKQLKWGWTASRAFMGELPLLTGSVYIHIDLPAPIHLANGCELDGAYVRHDRTRAACRVLLAPKAGIAWPNPADHGDVFCLGLREPRGAVGEGVDNALAQAESLFTGRGIERRDTP